MKKQPTPKENKREGSSTYHSDFPQFLHKDLGLLRLAHRVSKPTRELPQWKESGRRTVDIDSVRAGEEHMEWETNTYTQI
jgi:hypothetical protein